MNYNYFLPCFVSAAAILAAGGALAQQCVQAPSCAELGYTDSVADCTDNGVLYCPFDKSKVFCRQEDGSCERTCDELLAENNCLRYNDGDTIRGTFHQDICLFGTVTGSSVTLNRATVWDAGKRWPVCESEMNGRAKLDLTTLSIRGTAIFHTDVDIDRISYTRSQHWSAEFHGNTRMQVLIESDFSYTPALELDFYGELDETGTSYKKTTNEISLICSPECNANLSGRCEVDIYQQGADVTYCSKYAGGGSCDKEVIFNCDNDGGGNNAGVCTEKTGTCPTSW